MAEDTEIRSQEWVERIESLVHQAEAIPDAQTRNLTSGLLRAVLEFHAAGLERVMELLFQAGPVGEKIIDRITGEELTSSLLLLHGLHPDDTQTRLERAVEKLQEMFQKLGAKLTMTSLQERTVCLQFESERTWSVAAVKNSVEKVILQAAPEINIIEVSGIKETPQDGFVPIADLLAGMHV